MKTSPITLALALALTSFQVWQLSAAELTASLILQNFYGPGAIYLPWQTNTSSAASLYRADSVPNAQGATSARYGNLEVSLFDKDFRDTTPPGDDKYAGKADPQATWSDTIIITNAALNGTGGHYRPAFRYWGTLHASARSDGNFSTKFSTTAVSLSVVFNYQSFNDYNELDVSSAETNATLEINLDADGLAAANGYAQLDVPFVFGQPFPISASVTMTAYGGGGGIYVSGSEQTGYAQLQWLRGQVFDANSNLITDFRMISESGIDWALSQNVAVVAPRISGIALSHGTNVVLDGAGGLLGHPVSLLTSTNLALPMMNWDHWDTNYFDYSGQVSFTNAARSGEPRRFFRLQSQ